VKKALLFEGLRLADAAQEELQAAQIPIGWRDHCAHLLLPLNKCRRANFYLPWRCEHERHAYDKCEYLDYKRRVLLKQAEKKQEGS
jgi:NADH dehydrogenase (ubiquinone) 1 beta subcomplex subunit 7